VMAFKGHFQSPANRPDRYPGWGKGQYSGIVSNAAQSPENPLFIFFTRFIGISHFTKAPDNYLGGKRAFIPDRPITAMVKVVYAKYFFIKSKIGNISAGSISLADRFKKLNALFFGGQKLDLEGQFHKICKR
ncbi:MAG TPA: hypothetical protein VMV20_02055, partial [Chitinophagaceae bacterium]|nr:hypothetical protein [Chitinophagaceae bacterium]